MSLKMITAVFILLLSAPSRGNVNALNGSFFLSKSFSVVELNYDHQNQKTGKFGLGWCSNIEHRLEATNKSELKLTVCGSGLSMIFYKKVNSEDYTLASNELALFPRIKTVGRGFEVALSQNEHFKFSEDFVLTEIEKRGKRFSIDWDEKALTVRDEAKKVEIQLYINQKRQVSQIKTQNETFWLIRKGSLLTEISDINHQKTWNFAYDESQRMKKAMGPELGEMNISYDKMENVVSLVSDENCREKFEYKKVNSNEFTLNISGSCKEKPVASRFRFKINKHEIVSEKVDTKGKVLFQQIENKDTAQLIYRADDRNNVQSFSQDGALEYQTWSGGDLLRSKFDNNGKLIQIEQGNTSGFTEASFQYNPAGKISVVKLKEQSISVEQNSEDATIFKAKKISATLRGERAKFHFGNVPLEDRKAKMSFTEAREVLAVTNAINFYKESEKIYAY